MWKVRSVGSEGCGKRGVWKVRIVESTECGKCGVWKVRSVENDNNKQSILLKKHHFFNHL